MVFEVSGSQPDAEMMTKLAKVRGRIVVVAIFAKPPKIDLFQVFWRELKKCGSESTNRKITIRLSRWRRVAVYHWKS